MNGSRARWWRMAAAGVAIALAVTLALELAFRVAFRDHYGGLGPGGWDHWRAQFDRRNALGHRDREFTAARPDGVCRILAIGDSFTLGEGIESLEDVFTEVLEDRLNTSSERDQPVYEVLNVSGARWEIDDYLAALRDPGLSYEPNILLLAIYINDIEDRSHPRPTRHTLPQRLAALHWRLSRLARHSYFYWYTVETYANWKHKQFRFDYVRQYTHPDSADYRRFEGYYTQILALARERSVPVIVAVLPYLVDLDETHPFIGTYARLADFAREHGAAAVDLFPVLRQYDVRELRAGLTRWLASVQAHRIIAEKLVEPVMAIPCKET